MKAEFLTDEEVETEIKRLEGNDFVRLARKEQRVKNKRRQRMYTLRMFEKRGKELANQGITFESLDNELSNMEEDND